MTEINKLSRVETPHFTQTHPNPTIQRTLIRCYQQASMIPGFPFDKCSDAMEIVERALQLPLSRGFFRLDRRRDGELFVPHTWATDTNGRIIEFTGNQFNKYLLDPYKLPEGIIIIEPDDPLRARYTFEYHV